MCTTNACASLSILSQGGEPWQDMSSNLFFSDEIQNYVNDKNAAGFNGDNFRSNLIGFDKFCVEQGIQEPVFSYHASRWLEQRKNESHTTHYSRINASKHFLKYLSIKGYDVYVVRDIKYKGTDFQPHIYILIQKRKTIFWL